MKERLASMVDALRAQGHRISPKRLAVLRVLARSEGHPDVARLHREVRRAFPSTSLATVYKTVGALKEAGQILELEFSGLPNRYDGFRPFPHPHVICEGCGRIVDAANLDLEPIVEAMGRETGFEIRASRVDFFGRCPDCRPPGRD